MDWLLSLKCTCPCCFEEIHLGKCKIVSNSGKVLKDPSKKILARLRVEPLEGHRYALELAQRQCYKCDYLLPYNIEQVPSLMLVVVGDPFSGKSHYIASLIHQIKEEWIANASGFARFVCLTPNIEELFDEKYFKPLFVEKRALAATSQ